MNVSSWHSTNCNSNFAHLLTFIALLILGKVLISGGWFPFAEWGKCDQWKQYMVSKIWVAMYNILLFSGQMSNFSILRWAALASLVEKISMWPSAHAIFWSFPNLVWKGISSYGFQFRFLWMVTPLLTCSFINHLENGEMMDLIAGIDDLLLVCDFKSTLPKSTFSC